MPLSAFPPAASARKLARASRGASPAPGELRAIVDGAGCTVGRAAELCRASLRGFHEWLSGSRRMPAAAVELLCLAIVAEGLRAPGPWCAPWVRPALLELARRGMPETPPDLP